MSFTATTEVVATLRWRYISKMFLEMLGESIVLDSNNESKILDHYNYLLQVTSWNHNINWEPSFNKVTVLVPNEWGTDTRDFDAKVHRDALSNEMIKIIKEVSVARVLSHFSSE